MTTKKSGSRGFTDFQWEINKRWITHTLSVPEAACEEFHATMLVAAVDHKATYRAVCILTLYAPVAPGDWSQSVPTGVLHAIHTDLSMPAIRAAINSMVAPAEERELMLHTLGFYED